MSIPSDLTFEQKNKDGHRIFILRYQTPYHEFKIRIFAPEEWSNPKFYDDLANGVYINPYDQSASRTYDFTDVDGGPSVTLSDNGLATFKIGRGSSKMKFLLSFRACQAAFKEMATQIRLPLEDN